MADQESKRLRVTMKVLESYPLQSTQQQLSLHYQSVNYIFNKILYLTYPNRPLYCA